MLRIELEYGTTPHEAATKLVETAKELDMVVEGRLNGIVMQASKESTICHVELQWYKTVFLERPHPREIDDANLKGPKTVRLPLKSEPGGVFRDYKKSSGDVA